MHTHRRIVVPHNEALGTERAGDVSRQTGFESHAAASQPGGLGQNHYTSLNPHFFSYKMEMIDPALPASQVVEDFKGQGRCESRG